MIIVSSFPHMAGHVYRPVCMYVLCYACMYVMYVCICIYTCMYDNRFIISAYGRPCVPTCMYVCIMLCMYVCNVCMYIYIYI